MNINNLFNILDLKYVQRIQLDNTNFNHIAIYCKFGTYSFKMATLNSVKDPYQFIKSKLSEKYRDFVLYISEQNGFISDEHKKDFPSLHFCPDWDEMPITHELPEFEIGCLCEQYKCFRKDR